MAREGQYLLVGGIARSQLDPTYQKQNLKYFLKILKPGRKEPSSTPLIIKGYKNGHRYMFCVLEPNLIDYIL